MVQDVYSVSVKIFSDENNEFSVRFIEYEGEIWTVARDVLRGFGYDYSTTKIRNNTLEEEQKKLPIQTNGGIQEVTTLNFSGLEKIVDSLVIRDKRAKRFKTWLQDEYYPVADASLDVDGVYGYVDDDVNENVFNPSYQIENFQERYKQWKNEMKQLEDLYAENERLKKENVKLHSCSMDDSLMEMIVTQKEYVTTEELAKDYGFSEEEMEKLIHEKFVLKYPNYIDLEMGKISVRWSRLGRLKIYRELKKNGIVPEIEQ